MDKLPTETLLQIFFERITLGEAMWKENPAGSLYPNNVVGVCRRWRDIALSYPPLWTTILVGESIRFTFNTLAKISLKRSRNRPLRVYIVVGQPRPAYEVDPRFGEIIQKAIPRASEIRVHLSRRTHLAVFWTILKATPAPRLECLEILYARGHSQPRHLVEPHSDIPTTGLFDDTTPSLRHLAVRGNTLPFIERSLYPLSQGLYHLELAEDVFQYKERLPLPLRHLSVAAPTLTSLILESHQMFAVSPSPRCIAFPHLQDLHIKGAAPYAAAILNSVTVPETTAIRVQLFYDYEVLGATRPHQPLAGGAELIRGDRKGFLSALQNAMFAGRAATPTIALSVAREGDLVTHRFWTAHRPTELRGSSSGDRRLLGVMTAFSPPRLTFTNSPAADFRIDVAKLMEALPLASCELLHLSNLPADPFLWRGESVFASVPNVLAMEVWGDTAARAVRSLLGSSTPTPLRRLRRVTLVDTSWPDLNFLQGFDGDVPDSHSANATGDAEVVFRRHNSL